MRKPPALPDSELRETLDLLTQALADISKKLDEQIDIQNQMAASLVIGFQAIAIDVAAIQEQTDPAGYSGHIGQEVRNALAPILDKLTTLQDGFATDRRENRS